MAITAVLAKLSAIYSNLSKSDGLFYGVQNGEFAEIPTGVAEAPLNGALYGRKDAGWVSIPAPTSLTVGQIRRLIILGG